MNPTRRSPAMQRARKVLWFLPMLVAIVPFARLAAEPSGLIVDPSRPSVDRDLPDDSRSLGNDLTRLFLPHHARIAREVARTGKVAGWDPWGFGGRPLVGNPQAGLWYPPIWLAWRWWTPSALGWLTVAHLAAGGLGIYVLARALRIRPFGSAIAGGLYATAPYVLGQTYEGHYPHVWAECLYPFTLRALLAWRSDGLIGRSTVAWRAALPVLLALSALTGHVQEGFYLGLVLGAWIAVQGARRFRRDRSLPRPRSVAAIVGLLAIVVGLLAVEWLPDSLALQHVRRGLRPTAADASKYRVHPANLLQILSPFALGGPSDYRGPGSYWESLLSIGLVPLTLAIAGAAWSRNRRAALALSALALASILFAFGRGGVVFDVLFATVPGMGRFRVPARSLFLASLAGALLAGMGIDAIARRARGRPRLATALGVLALVETCGYGLALIRVAPASQFVGPEPVGRAMAALAPDAPFRIRARDSFYGDARAFALGFEKTNLYDSFQIGCAADLYERLYPMFGAPIPARFPQRFRPDLQADILDRMNVLFLVTDRDDDRFGWPIAASGTWRGERYTIRRNPRPLPRAYVVPAAQVVPDGPGSVDRFLDFPARESVIMPRDPMPVRGPRQPFTPAEYDARGPDRIEVKVATEHPGLLVVADTWMPGWNATLDGSPAPILRGNRGQRVVVLSEPGRHRVVMTYTPPGLSLGRGITLATLAAWLTAAAFALARSGSPRGRTAGRTRSGPGPSPRRACSAAGARPAA